MSFIFSFIVDDTNINVLLEAALSTLHVSLMPVCFNKVVQKNKFGCKHLSGSNDPVTIYFCAFITLSLEF